MARAWAVEGFSTAEMTLAIMLCLHHFEPQASSLMGASTLLFASGNGQQPECWQSTGRHDQDWDLKGMMKKLLRSHAGEFLGAAATALPTDIRSFVALAESMRKDWEQSFEKVFDRLHATVRLLQGNL